MAHPIGWAELDPVATVSTAIADVGRGWGVLLESRHNPTCAHRRGPPGSRPHVSGNKGNVVKFHGSQKN